MSDVIYCTIPGSPGPAKINGRMIPIIRGRRPVLIKSKEYRDWQARAVPIIQAAANGAEFWLGPVAVSIAAYWPTMHRTGPAAGLPLGDVDAVVKAVLDALETADLLGSDAQVSNVSLSKHYDKLNPRIDVLIWQA